MINANDFVGLLKCGEMTTTSIRVMKWSPVAALGVMNQQRVGYFVFYRQENIESLTL